MSNINALATQMGEARTEWLKVDGEIQTAKEQYLGRVEQGYDKLRTFAVLTERLAQVLVVQINALQAKPADAPAPAPSAQAPAQEMQAKREDNVLPAIAEVDEDDLELDM